MTRLLILLLLPVGLLAATIDCWVYGSRDVTGINYDWTGNGYVVTTNYSYTLTAQVPKRPNGTWLGWEREWNLDGLTERPTWAQVSNRVARVVFRELSQAGISTNGHTVRVRRGKRVAQ